MKRLRQILLYRRDCGGDPSEAAEGAPVFVRWQKCVPFEEAVNDVSCSWVPIMNLNNTILSLENMGMSHDRADAAYAPIDALRAQHFVSAFASGNDDQTPDHRKNVYFGNF